MLRTLFSTTWRIFGPVTVLFIIGLIIDLTIATKPWGILIGTGIGIIIAVGLVVEQLRSFNKSAASPKNKIVKETS